MTVKATCWKVTRQDGTVLLATSLDIDVVVTATGYEGTYFSASGIQGSAIKNVSTMAVDSLEVNGATNAAAEVEAEFFVSPGDVEAGLYDGARVRVFETDIADTSTVNVLVSGVLGQITRTFEGGYTTEVRNLLQLLQQNIGENISITCRAKLGSGVETPVIRRCGLDLSAFTVTGSITSIERDRYRFTDSTRSEEALWFRDGIVTWTGGNNTGFQSQIRRHQAAGVFVLDGATPYAMQVSDTYSMTPGCDHTLPTCRDKFDNVVNFRGEPYIPGMDAIIAGEGST